MQLEKQKNEMKRLEAWRVYGALMVSCLECLMSLSHYFVQSFQCDIECSEM